MLYACKEVSMHLLRVVLIVSSSFTMTVAAAVDDMPPPSLWKWSNSASSYNNYAVPNSSANADYNTKSGCGGGGDDKIGWACPHQMLLSPDMQYAAKEDGNSWALYGVAGIGQVSDCGTCYQLQITEGGSPSPNNYIVQAVNTGSDVGSGQFDIMVGGGGFGIYDACSSDCQYGRVCSGGHCNAPYYSGDFNAWVPDGNCYGGGIHSASQCYGLSNGQLFLEKTLLYGCTEAINRAYHSNFQVQWKRVQCPPSLYKVTGLRRKDDIEHPVADLELALTNSGRTTTMMDCCKPTCSWRQNIADIADPEFPQVYTCNKNGQTN